MLALVRDSDCCVYATNMQGFGGGGLGSNQTVAGLKHGIPINVTTNRHRSNQTVAGLKLRYNHISVRRDGSSNQTVAGLKRRSLENM